MTHRPRLLVVNGPNLNMLGRREPHLYGSDTLADVELLMRSKAEAEGLDIDFFQSNWEGAIIDRLHEARNSADGVVINPAGLTTVSIALLDALQAIELPTVEVHITNIHKREAFRHESYVSKTAEAVIAGAGIAGYGFAVELLAQLLRKAI